MDASLNRLKTREIPPVPQNILDSFEDHRTTLIPFEERSRALVEPAFRKENGVREFQDGSFMMSVSCPMHGVTKDMLAWWAWWFPQDVERYCAWMPSSNLDISYSEDDADYFNADRMPPFRPVTLYPLQKTGDLKLPFRIDLVMPSDFGFTDEDIKAAGDPLVICGRIKSVKGGAPLLRLLLCGIPDGLRLSVQRQMLDWTHQREPAPPAPFVEREADDGYRTLMLRALHGFRSDSPGALLEEPPLRVLCNQRRTEKRKTNPDGSVRGFLDSITQVEEN